jgi:chromosome segregation ATPase
VAFGRNSNAFGSRPGEPATSGATDWQTERARLNAECEQLRNLLADTEEAAALALDRQVTSAVERTRAELGEECVNLAAENAALKQMLADTDQAAAIALERQIATAVERARTDLDAVQHKLREELDELRQAAELLKEERDRAIAALAEAPTAAPDISPEIIERLQSEFAAVRDALIEKQKAAAEGSLRARTELAEISMQWESTRARFLEERTRLKAETERVTEERNRLASECEQAKAQLSIMQRGLDHARSGGAMLSGGTAAQSDAILAEVDRVEALIQGIARVVDDPETDLSDIVRRNVERAELESYLNGLRFLMDCGQQAATAGFSEPNS